MNISNSKNFGKTAAIIITSSIILTGCNNPFKSGKSNRLKSEVEGLQMVLENRDKEITQLKGENARLSVLAGVSPGDMGGVNVAETKPRDINPNGDNQKPANRANNFKPSNNNKIDYAMNGTYGVHIASYRIRENAVVGWKKIHEKYLDLFNGGFAKLMQLNLPSLGGTYFRMKIGPFATLGAASYLCAELKKRGEFCNVTPFDGDLLN